MSKHTVNLPTTLRSFQALTQGLEEALQGQHPTNGCHVQANTQGWRVELGQSWLQLPSTLLSPLRANTPRENGHLLRLLPVVLMGLFKMGREDYEAKRAFGGRTLLAHGVLDEENETFHRDKLRRLATTLGHKDDDERLLKRLERCMHLLKHLEYGYTIGTKTHEVKGFFSVEETLVPCDTIPERRSGLYQVIKLNEVLFGTSLKKFIKMPVNVLESGDTRLVLATFSVIAEKSYKKEKRELEYDAFRMIRDCCVYQPRRSGFKREIVTYLKPQLDKLVELGVLVSYAFKEGIELCFPASKPKVKRKPPKEASSSHPQSASPMPGMTEETWQTLKRGLFEEFKALLCLSDDALLELKPEPG